MADVKAVIDTQIVVRGLVRRQRSAAVEVFERALARRGLVGVTSPLLLDEVSRILRLPEIRGLARPPLEDELIDRAVLFIADRFLVAPGAFQDVEKVPDDAKDNPLVEAALEAEAEAIVSDDVDLLSLKVVKVAGFRPIHIYAPGPFIKHELST